MDILTLHALTATITALSTHLKAGIGISNKGLKKPLLNVVFLYLSKTQGLKHLVYSVMVGRVGEPVKRFASSFAGMPILHAPPPLIGIIGGGYSLLQRNHHVTN